MLTLSICNPTARTSSKHKSSHAKPFLQIYKLFIFSLTEGQTPTDWRPIPTDDPSFSHMLSDCPMFFLLSWPSLASSLACSIAGQYCWATGLSLPLSSVQSTLASDLCAAASCSSEEGHLPEGASHSLYCPSFLKDHNEITAAPQYLRVLARLFVARILPTVSGHNYTSHELCAQPPLLNSDDVQSGLRVWTRMKGTS